MKAFCTLGSLVAATSLVAGSPVTPPGSANYLPSTQQSETIPPDWWRFSDLFHPRTHSYNGTSPRASQKVQNVKQLVKKQVQDDNAGPADPAPKDKDSALSEMYKVLKWHKLAGHATEPPVSEEGQNIKQFARRDKSEELKLEKEIAEALFEYTDEAKDHFEKETGLDFEQLGTSEVVAEILSNRRYQILFLNVASFWKKTTEEYPHIAYRTANTKLIYDLAEVVEFTMVLEGKYGETIEKLAGKLSGEDKEKLDYKREALDESLENAAFELAKLEREFSSKEPPAADKLARRCIPGPDGNCPHPPKPSTSSSSSTPCSTSTPCPTPTPSCKPKKPCDKKPCDKKPCDKKPCKKCHSKKPCPCSSSTPTPTPTSSTKECNKCKTRPYSTPSSSAKPYPTYQVEA
ncbi:MAG: hypothetical protein M1831_000324 [Alyxoria varia]|nr:MAG: hypothetical protein M1831_000324 [Alyxoria varia]